MQVDLDLVDAAAALVDEALAQIDAEVRELTSGAVEGVTQNSRLTEWLNEQGVNVESIDKYAIAELLKVDYPDNIRRVLELRAEGAKSSTAKLRALRTRACGDGRVRDNLVYHGASTGRWSAKGIQPQNMPRPTLKDRASAIAMIRAREPAWFVDAFLGPPMAVVSDCLRGMLVAGPGMELIGADFKAIEARVLAWFAGQRKLLELFADDEDVYRYMAGEIYSKTISKVTKEERQLGKAATLGCGHGLGAAKFCTTCAKAGILIDETMADRVVRTYRDTNDRIVALWRELERGAIAAVQQPGAVIPIANGRARFSFREEFLWLVLPSRRLLAYYQPEVRDCMTPWDEVRPQLTYMGVDTFTHQWSRQTTYGGRWAENLVSATARDLLAAAMLRLEAAGYPIVLSVHDEAVAEVPIGFGSVDEFEEIMCRLPDWAAGCTVAAEGWRSTRYGEKG